MLPDISPDKGLRRAGLPPRAPGANRGLSEYGAPTPQQAYANEGSIGTSRYGGSSYTRNLAYDAKSMAHRSNL